MTRAINCLMAVDVVINGWKLSSKIQTLGLCSLGQVLFGTEMSIYRSIERSFGGRAL